MGKASKRKKAKKNTANPLLENRLLESAVVYSKAGLLSSSFIHIILIAIVGFLVYSNTFSVPFHFDDRNIFKNPIVKNFNNSGSSSADIYSKDVFKSRYAGYLTFALNKKINGLNVSGYHVVNLSIHIANAFLIYFLVILSFRTPYLIKSSLREHSKYIALFSSLFFLSHPVQTQAVTYIAQRLASLATMFYILSIVSYIKSRVSTPYATRYTLYAVSLVSAVLAMKTKETAFTLPVAITLYEFMFLEGKIKRRLLYLIPLLFTMLIIPLTFITINKPVGDLIGDVSEATRVQTSMSRFDYLFTQFRVVVTYLRLLFFPIDQRLVYDYPIYHSLLVPQVYLPFLFLLSIFGLGVFLFRRSKVYDHGLRLISFGIFWFFITLSVESSIIPIVDVIFEHRVYLPSVGVSFAIMSGIFLLSGRLKSRKTQIIAASFFILLQIMFAIAAYARNNVWGSEISLWEDVVRKSPKNVRGHNNLGDVYWGIGLNDKAIEQYEIAIRIDPDYAGAHYNLGYAYRAKGLNDKAIEQYEIAIRIDPDNADAHNNLGSAYRAKGLTDKAIEHYRLALSIKPDYAGVHYNLGIAYEVKGLTDRAIEHYQLAIKLEPDFAEAHNNLGEIYLGKKLIDRARREFEIALQINPDLHQARKRLDYINKIHSL